MALIALGGIINSFVNEPEGVDLGNIPNASVNPFGGGNLVGSALSQQALLALGDPRFAQATSLGNVFTEINQAASTGLMSRGQAKGATRLGQQLETFIDQQVAAGADAEAISAELERFLSTTKGDSSLGVDIVSEIAQMGNTGQLGKKDAKKASKVAKALQEVGQDAVGRGQDAGDAVLAALQGKEAGKKGKAPKAGKIFISGKQFTTEEVALFNNAFTLSGRDLEDLENFGVQKTKGSDRKAFRTALGVLGRTPRDIVAAGISFRQQQDTINEALEGGFGQDAGERALAQLEATQEIADARLEATRNLPEVAELVGVPTEVVEELRAFEGEEGPEGLTDLNLLGRAEEFLPNPEDFPGIQETEELVKANLIEELDRQFGQRVDDVLTQANFAGINPGAQLAELERERSQRLRQIDFDAQQLAVDLVSGRQNLQVGELGLAGGVQGFEASNLTLEAQLNELAQQELAAIATPELTAQNVLANAGEIPSAILDPAFQQGALSAGIQNQQVIASGQIAASQAQNISSAAQFNESLALGSQAQQNAAFSDVGGNVTDVAVALFGGGGGSSFSSGGGGGGGGGGG